MWNHIQVVYIQICLNNGFGGRVGPQWVLYFDIGINREFFFLDFVSQKGFDVYVRKNLKIFINTLLSFPNSLFLTASSRFDQLYICKFNNHK